MLKQSMKSYGLVITVRNVEHQMHNAGSYNENFFRIVIRIIIIIAFTTNFIMSVKSFITIHSSFLKVITIDQKFVRIEYSIFFNKWLVSYRKFYVIFNPL